MHLNALLDVDVVAVEAEDRVSVLLELVAPVGQSDRERQPATPQVVLDRRGSMGGGQLDAAKAALDALVTRLDPADNFGLVVFDDTVEVALAAGPLHDKTAARPATPPPATPLPRSSLARPRTSREGCCAVSRRHAA